MPFQQPDRPHRSVSRLGSSALAVRPMGDEKHDKFVLKERQRLQAREKELEKREAEFQQLKQQNVSLQSELEAKAGQLAQTAELLRRRDEERDAAKRSAEQAHAALQQVREQAAKASADSGADAAKAEAKEAHEARAAAEAEASKQSQSAEESRQAAEEARAALEAALVNLKNTDESLHAKEKAILELQLNAQADQSALQRARDELERQQQQLSDASASVESLKKVPSRRSHSHCSLLATRCAGRPPPASPAHPSHRCSHWHWRSTCCCCSLWCGRKVSWPTRRRPWSRWRSFTGGTRIGSPRSRSRCGICTEPL